jgi:hypothetical protein
MRRDVPTTEAPVGSPGHYRTSWTFEEVLALPENGMRQELFGGRRIESPVPPKQHQLAATRLMGLLDDVVASDLATVPATDLRIGPDLLVPDVTLALSEAVCDPDSVHLEPQDVLLVVEIFGPGDACFERAWKPQRYADAGIPFYVEVRLAAPRVRVYKLRGTGYAEIADAHAGEILKLAEPFELSFDPAELVGPRH